MTLALYDKNTHINLKLYTVELAISGERVQTRLIPFSRKHTNDYDHRFLLLEIIIRAFSSWPNFPNAMHVTGSCVEILWIIVDPEYIRINPFVWPSALVTMHDTTAISSDRLCTHMLTIDVGSPGNLTFHNDTHCADNKGKLLATNASNPKLARAKITLKLWMTGFGFQFSSSIRFWSFFFLIIFFFKIVSISELIIVDKKINRLNPKKIRILAYLNTNVEENTKLNRNLLVITQTTCNMY